VITLTIPPPAAGREGRFLTLARSDPTVPFTNYPARHSALFTDQKSAPILKAGAAEGPAVKRGHRQRSLPLVGGRPYLHA